ncbi:MAG: MATE family efflux transporter [bacterium]|nr:MATE family efflux transporter [candidate division KSB1 bacterium]MDH7559496.1 MATE family efflux transporter [bacterium]
MGRQLRNGDGAPLHTANPVLWRRWSAPGGYAELVRVGVPLILSTGFWSIQQFVDRMFLSWYSPEAVAAASPAGLVAWTIASVFVGTAAYVDTFVAQYYGARQYGRIGPAVWQGVYLTGIAAVAGVGAFLVAEPLFALTGHPPGVLALEVRYYRVLSLGMFAPVLGSALSSFFSGRGDTWVVMWASAIATLTNVVLDYALIFGKWGMPELGITGAALATVASGLVAVAVYAVLFLGQQHDGEFRTRRGWRPEGELFKRLLRFGLPSGMHFFLDILGFTAFVIIAGRLGTAELAATNIAFNINSLAFMPLYGIGIAVSILVGQWIGADRPDLAEKSTWSGFHLSAAYMTLFAFGYLVFPRVFLRPFAAQADAAQMARVFATAVVLLRFVAAYSLFDAMNVIFGSAIKGAGDTRFVALVNVALSWAVMVIPSYVAVSVFGKGLLTMWGAATLYIMLVGLTFLLRFLRGKWKSMRVIEVPRTGVLRVPEGCHAPEGLLGALPAGTTEEGREGLPRVAGSNGSGN